MVAATSKQFAADCFVISRTAEKPGASTIGPVAAVATVRPVLPGPNRTQSGLPSLQMFAEIISLCGSRVRNVEL